MGLRARSAFFLLTVAAFLALDVRAVPDPCRWRELAPNHIPTHQDISQHPSGEPMLSIPADRMEQNRIGMLVETNDGRVVFLVSRFLSGGGHRGLNEFLNQQLAAQGASGEKIGKYLWAGEIRLERNPSDPQKPHITEINPASGFLNQILSETGIPPSANNPAVLKKYLDESLPGLVAKDAKLTSFDSKNAHLDRAMSNFVAARDADYREELREWKAKGSKGSEPQRPNFRHDINNVLSEVILSMGLLKMSENFPVEGMKKMAEEMAKKAFSKRGPIALDWLRLMEEDGVHVVENPGTPNEIDHLRRTKLGLQALVAGKPPGIDIGEIEKSFRIVIDRDQQNARLTDGENAATDPQQRSLLPNNVEIFQLSGPK